MENVNGKEFYHLQRFGTRKWKSNEIYDIGQEHSDYIKKCFSGDGYYPGNYPKRQVLQALIQYYKGKEATKSPELMNLYDEIPKILELSHSALTYVNKMLREIIFEQVREKYYPQYPSRYKCVWLIPLKKECISYWKKTLPYTRGELFKVSVEGKIHKVNDDFLNIDSSFYQDYIDNAHLYWKSANIHNEEKTEIIFVGNLKVLEVIESR